MGVGNNFFGLFHFHTGQLLPFVPSGFSKIPGLRWAALKFISQFTQKFIVEPYRRNAKQRDS